MVRKVEMIEHFPFMLNASKHSEPFFSNLLAQSTEVAVIAYLTVLANWADG
jgi:hypothetical protein